jgi:hypothetical protein
MLRNLAFFSIIPGSRVPSGLTSPSRVTKSRDSMTSSRTASCAASIWVLLIGAGRSLLMVIKERYSNDVAAEVRMKFFAYRARHLAKLNVGYSSVPDLSRFTTSAQS